ncbi:MAG: M20/M25/M40 family metallo-hydrolase [Oscillospiraceae bacterium]|nr:M20/M25/M40 family metallo-hydrolase [Oscillospiraceae bacterium]
MDIKQVCFDLAKRDGTPGDEGDIARYASSLLEKYMPCRCNALGSVIGTFGGNGTHILLDAHIDRVGMVVRGIDEKGFLLIDRVGGIDARVLTGAEVTVHGKETLFGVVCSVPPHLQKKDGKNDSVDISTMAVDIGMDKQAAEKLVEIGDRITFRDTQCELLGGNIVSPAFDDRCCVAAIVRAIDMVKDKIKAIKVTVLFSTEEETGGAGAATGAFAVGADYAIAVDVGFGSDPYTDSSQTITLGKGPSIGFSPVLDRSLTAELKELCKNADIPYQHDVMGGRTGTNADCISISAGGVKTALLSVPLRYMHTGCEIIHVEDIENTAKLIAAYLLKKEAESHA